MRTLTILLCGGVFLVAVGPAHSAPASSDREPIEIRVPEHRSSQRSSSSVSGSRQEMRVFESEEGTPMLTNRPEKYRNQPGLVEVELDYDPIVVPDRLRRLSQRDRHSASDLADLVSHYCSQYVLDEALLFAIIRVESDFDPGAVSPAGARGLMQLMPATAEEMGVSNIFDTAQNIAGGAQYLARMLELFDDDLRLALAAYNAGPATVQQYGGVPPFRETQNYIRLVKQYADLYESEGIEGLDVSPGSSGLAHQKQEPPEDSTTFTVHFHSGLTQIADNVAEKDTYYHLEYRGRTIPVRKDLVSRIEEPA